MKIGVPKEIKIHEYRVGLVPAGVRELVDSGHQVIVQSGRAGIDSKIRILLRAHDLKGRGNFQLDRPDREVRNRN